GFEAWLRVVYYMHAETQEKDVPSIIRRNWLAEFWSVKRPFQIAGMRILLDEWAPLPMRDIFVRHECTAPKNCRWKGIKNCWLVSAQGRQSLPSQRFPTCGSEPGVRSRRLRGQR